MVEVAAVVVPANTLLLKSVTKMEMCGKNENVPDLGWVQDYLKTPESTSNRRMKLFPSKSSNVVSPSAAIIGSEAKPDWVWSSSELGLALSGTERKLTFCCHFTICLILFHFTKQ